MRTYFKSGELVGSGCYLSLKNGNELVVGSKLRALPGEVDATWMRLPWPVVVLLAPVVSILFVILLPFIGIAMTAYVAIGALVENVAKIGKHPVVVAAEPAAPAAPKAEPDAYDGGLHREEGKTAFVNELERKRAAR